MHRLVTPAFLLLTCSLLAQAAWSQVVVQQGGGYGGYVNPMGQSLQWLWNPQMEKELAIVDEQREALTKLRNDVMTKMRSLYDMKIEDQTERMKKYNESAKALSEETEKKVQEILLPQQLKRIKQIALQMQLQYAGYGSASAFANDSLAADLNITEEQKAKLQEKQREIAKENQEKTQAFYKQLQDEAREKLLSVLTAEQRKKLDEMIGEKFQWQPYQQGNPGGAGGVRRLEGPKDGN